MSSVVCCNSIVLPLYPALDMIMWYTKTFKARATVWHFGVASDGADRRDRHSFSIVELQMEVVLVTKSFQWLKMFVWWWMLELKILCSDWITPHSVYACFIPFKYTLRHYQLSVDLLMFSTRFIMVLSWWSWFFGADTVKVLISANKHTDTDLSVIGWPISGSSRNLKHYSAL